VGEILLPASVAAQFLRSSISKKPLLRVSIAGGNPLKWVRLIDTPHDLRTSCNIGLALSLP
jgi:hypothetical protein